jgi:uncharacterized damage-inducible protein DinB
MDNVAALRAQLARMLDWEDAHVGFDAAVADLEPVARGTAPAGFPHTAWQLVEHIRLTQRDILDFCRDPGYVTPSWPADYWPPTPAPPDERAWASSVNDCVADRAALAELALDGSVDLFATIPHGTGQSYLRELLLVADHTSYHVGQLVALRRQLGAWPVA